tara:strand:- start:4709 stop:8179 length:3471 start_codon:yes stop_codon:yes gene_type:complete
MADIKPFQEKSHLRQSPSVDFSGVEAQSRLWKQIADETSSLANRFFNDAAATAKSEGSTSGKNAMSMNPNGTIMRHSIPDAGEIYTSSFIDAQNQAVQSATLSSMREHSNDLLLKLQNNPNRVSEWDKQHQKIVETFLNSSDPDIKARIATDGEIFNKQGRRSLLQIDIKQEREKLQNNFATDIRSRVTRLNTSARAGAGIDGGDFNTDIYGGEFEAENLSAELTYEYKTIVDDIIRAKNNQLIKESKATELLQNIQESFLTNLAMSHFQTVRKMSPEIEIALNEIETTEGKITGIGPISLPEEMGFTLDQKQRKNIATTIRQEISKRKRIDTEMFNDETRIIKNRLSGLESAFNLTSIEGDHIPTMSPVQIKSKFEELGLIINDPRVSPTYTKLIASSYNSWRKQVGEDYDLSITKAVGVDEENGTTDEIEKLMGIINPRSHPKHYDKLEKALFKQIKQIRKTMEKASKDAGKSWFQREIELGNISTRFLDKLIAETKNTDVNDRTEFQKWALGNSKSLYGQIKKVDDDRLRKTIGVSRSDINSLELKQKNGVNEGVRYTKKDVDTLVKLANARFKNDPIPENDFSLDTEQGVANNVALINEHYHLTPLIETMLADVKRGDSQKAKLLAQIWHQTQPSRELIDINPNDLKFLDNLLQVAGVLNDKVSANEIDFKSFFKNYTNQSFDAKRDKENDTKITENFVPYIHTLFDQKLAHTDLWNRTGTWWANDKNENDAILQGQPPHLYIFDSTTSLSRATTEQLKNKILPQVLLTTSGLEEEQVAQQVFSIATHKYHMGASAYAPYIKQDGSFRSWGENGLMLMSPENHTNSSIAANLTPILGGLLGQIMDREKSLIGTRFKQESFKEFGQPNDIMDDKRLQLTPDLSSGKKWHYTATIWNNDKDRSHIFSEPLILNEQTAAFYLDRIKQSQSLLMNQQMPNAVKTVLPSIIQHGERVFDEIKQSKASTVKQIKQRIKPFIDLGNTKQETRIAKGSPNQYAIDLLKRPTQEGFTPTLKKDSVGHVIGHGTNIKFLEPNERAFLNKVTNNLNDPISEADAETLTGMRVDRLVSNFRRNDGFQFDSMSNNRKAALVSVAYQVGWSNFAGNKKRKIKGFKDTILFIKARDWKKASKEILKSAWAKNHTMRSREIAKLLKDG